MPAPVVIDVGVADPAPEVVQALVEACTRAVGETECHLVREAPEGPYRAIAIVTWEGGDRVRIEVGLRREGSTEWRTRALAFQPADASVERFRSVGFVVGTLAGERVAEASLPPVPVAVPPVPVQANAPAAPVERASPSQAQHLARFIAVMGTLGAGLDRGAPRYGAALRGGVGIAPWVALIASAGVSWRPRDDAGLALRWLDAGAGVALRAVRPEPLGLELRFEALVEHFRANVIAGSRSDDRERVAFAGRAGIDGAWTALPPLSFVLGADVVGRPGSTRVEVAGRSEGATGLLEIGLSGGVRLDL